MGEEATGQGVLRLEGAVDIRGARRLLESVRARAAVPADLVVDCAAVERFDGAGLQILLALKAKIEARGRAFVLRGVPERILSFWELVGLRSFLSVESAEAAPASGEAPSLGGTSAASRPFAGEAPADDASPDDASASDAPANDASASDAPANEASLGHATAGDAATRDEPVGDPSATEDPPATARAPAETSAP